MRCQSKRRLYTAATEFSSSSMRVRVMMARRGVAVWIAAYSATACGGQMALAAAQRMIATDWLSAYRSRGLTPAQ
jgi:hypothetical protein